MDRLTPEQMRELIDFIADGTRANGQDISTFAIAESLFRFGDKCDLPAMYRYLKYSQEHGERKDAMLATIVHDLNGMDDSFFSPRTAGY